MLLLGDIRDLPVRCISVCVLPMLMTLTAERCFYIHRSPPGAAPSASQGNYLTLAEPVHPPSICLRHLKSGQCKSGTLCAGSQRRR